MNEGGKWNIFWFSIGFVKKFMDLPGGQGQGTNQSNGHADRQHAKIFERILVFY